MTDGTVPVPLPQKTIFYSMGMQMYMAETIKKPVIKAFDVLFDDHFSKWEKLKALKVLYNAFHALKGLPEPTKENTWHPNSHQLIDLRDWLLPRLNLSRERMGFIWRIINFVIIIYDFDPPWRWIMDNLKDEALKKEWKARGWADSWVGSYVWWKDKP